MEEGSSVSLLSTANVRPSFCNVHSNGPNELHNNPPSEDVQMSDASMTMISTFTQQRSQFDPVVYDSGRFGERKVVRSRSLSLRDPRISWERIHSRAERTP